MRLRVISFMLMVKSLFFCTNHSSISFRKQPDLRHAGLRRRLRKRQQQQQQIQKNECEESSKTSERDNRGQESCCEGITIGEGTEEIFCSNASACFVAVSCTKYSDVSNFSPNAYRTIKGNSFGFFLYSTLLHLPPLRFHCVGGCWDRT